MVHFSKFKIRNSKFSPLPEAGFTLMEVLVATTLFAFATVALTSLFNYTLKINRRAEALRQATQGMRNYVEFIVKEIRNGQIDYSVVNGQVKSNIVPCPKPSGSVNSTYANTDAVYGKTDTTLRADNALAIITPDGDRECIFLADKNGAYLTGKLAPDAADKPAKIRIQKNSLAQEDINPPNFQIDYLAFYVRPLTDPYSNTPNPPARIQPFVTMVVKFTATLPTGESVPIYYQTSVSSDKYDIPNN